MTRQYNSSRREAVAQQTRQAIVEAAVKLHGEGITVLSAVAEEAGVSLPTLTRYFPTREALFDACTSHVAASLEYTSPETLRAIQNPGERLQCVVQEIFRLHEEVKGQMWTGYKLEDESPILAQALKASEDSITPLIETLPFENAVEDPEALKRFVHAMLHPLTYRALRVKNGLSIDEAIRHMILSLAAVLNIEL